MPDENGVVTIKDFSFSPEPKKFKLYTDDPFIFEAPPVLPIGVMADAAKLRNINPAEEGVIDRIMSFFDSILLPESAVELRKRALASSAFPFGMNHIAPVIEWLLEAYGMRPTTPSSDSSNGSVTEQVDDSTTSTDGALSAESNPSDSPSTAS